MYETAGTNRPAEEALQAGLWPDPRRVYSLILGGHSACVYWSTVGDPKAADREIMDWARSKGYIVFTHDLDFGTMLALTQASGPSVIQVRGQNTLPDHLSPIVVAALKHYESDLTAGALVVVEEAKLRVRILPI